MRTGLKALQIKKNYTIEQMAKAGGVHRVTFYRILNNEIDGAFMFWMNIKKHFNLSTENLIAIYQENTKVKEDK